MVKYYRTLCSNDYSVKMKLTPCEFQMIIQFVVYFKKLGEEKSTIGSPDQTSNN